MVRNTPDMMSHYEQMCSINTCSCDVQEFSDIQKNPMVECRTCGNNAGVAGSLCTPNFFGT